LLPVVLGVWGMIGWKIYVAVNSDQETDVVVSITGNTDSLPSEIPETYELLLNYRDPFLDINKKSVHLPTDQRINLPKPSSVKPKESEETAVVQPDIRYYGLVKESNSQKTVGFLGVNSQTHFVATGDIIEAIKIMRIWSDSVEVIFDGKKKIIRR
jgi:hypothetical protein